MPAASTGGASAAMDCIHMTMPGQGDQAGKSVPCRTNNIDCLKQMACVGPLVLPARTGEQLAVTYVPVSYWPVAFSGTGRSIAPEPFPPTVVRSEEHTSELQSLMRLSYAVFFLKKK